MGAELQYFHPKTFWVQLVIHLSCCVLSSSAANVNLDVVLKQLEPQQMQMRVLRVKYEERKNTRDTDTAD